jgi:hypothetical protein
MDPVPAHAHGPAEPCPPACPAWSERAIELFAITRRYDGMLEACRAAERIEFLVVAPGVAGVELPRHLMDEELVRLDLVVGRDCPEVLLDEWGLRASLTFSRRRHECAIPWEAVVAGGLAPPRPPPDARPQRRFGVIDGGKKG